MKQCNTCHKFMDLKHFYIYKGNGKEYHRKDCKSCFLNKRKRSDAYLNNKQIGYDDQKARRQRYKQTLRVKYGESVAEALLHEPDSDVDIMRELNGY